MPDAYSAKREFVSEQKFNAIVASGAKGAVYIPLPFDPDALWGKRPRHHVHGTVNQLPIRGPLARDGDALVLTLGAAWRRHCGIKAGDKVLVVLAPEGPQRAALAPDIAAALAAEPDAAAFFDGLAQFYRKAYLAWIDATKTRPDERARRIAQTVAWLKAGKKERPRE